MVISTNYAYSTSIYTNTNSVGGPSNNGSGKPPAAATTLRNEAGVQLTLSPAALEALARQAAETTEDQQAAIIARLQQVLTDVMLTSGQEAGRADAEPLPTDPAHHARAVQAKQFLDGAAANPFAGKPVEDLAAVILNADGNTTLNERRAALSELARQDHARMMSEITPQSDFDRKVADAEEPKSRKPERLASAEQATKFLADKADNPFEGLPRQALTAIIDNDGGDYTVNERRAALAERTAQEKGILAQLARPMTGEAKRQADRMIPASIDPARRASARAATQFLDGRGDNPFAGLTKDELNAIVFNETGAYTMNERRAAHAELKQYLPATATADTTGEQESSESSTAEETSSDDDGYHTQAAYPSRLLRQLLDAQATSALLSAMASFNTSQPLGLLGYLGGGFRV